MKQENNNIYFSIILCCYNSEKYLEETINSIILQTHKLWEIIIVDDNSSDNSKRIINQFIKNGYPILYHYNINNLGLAKSRNIAVNLAHYDWITIIDHDDIMTSNRLEVQSNLIKSKSDIKFFFGNSEIFKKNKKISTKSDDFYLQYKKSLRTLSFDKKYLHANLIRYGCFIISSTVTFNKSCYKTSNGFNEMLRFTSDYEFFLRLSKIFDFYYIDTIINRWRSHSSQSTVKNKKNHYKELSYLLINNVINSKIPFSIKLYGIIKAIYYFFKF